MQNPCQFDPRWVPAEPTDDLVKINRRNLLQRTAAGVVGLTCVDFLRFFAQNGLPITSKDALMAAEAAQAAPEPRFLIYWYMEGGWESYDMFSPVVTPNNIFQRLDDVSKERYRVLNFGKPGYGIYELLRAGLTCASFIETRDIRKFDSHFNRRNLWEEDRRTPRGQPDQTKMMAEDLWKPLNALVELLRMTPCPGAAGKSLFDVTTIVLTSEFGRTIHGDVDAIQRMKIADDEKQKMIDGQDISQHWKVTSAAFLGGAVKGNSQYGGIGENTLLGIPLMPDGSMDPGYDPNTGELNPGARKSEKSFLPNHGDVYATALHLSGIDPKGKGRNDRGPLRFIGKRG